MKNIENDIAFSEGRRIMQPIKRRFEQERIVMSYLQSPDPKDHAKIDKIEKDPQLQKEVREMIDLCRRKVEFMNGRHGSFVPHVIPSFDSSLSTTD